jgi:predicted alpha/beta hydrolase family esterase
VYLSENNISKKIKAIILVSAPFDDKEGSSFNLSIPLLNFSEQCKNIYLIHSKDDLVVTFDQVLKYKELLPNAKVITFEDRGHFNQETFPELVELIKGIK